MSIYEQIKRIKTNIQNAYTALLNKGAELPEILISDNLPSTIENLKVGGGDDELLKGIIEGTATDIVLPDNITKIAGSTFGRIGNNVKYPSNLVSIKGNGIIEIGSYGVNDSNYIGTLKTIEFPNLKKIGNYGLSTGAASGSHYCIVEKIILGALEEIGQYAFNGLFNPTRSITQDIQMSFNNCVINDYAFRFYNLPSFDATGVKSFGKAVFDYAETSFKKVWFPSTIEAIYTTGTSSGKAMFRGANVTIYTDIPNETSVPTTWGTGWNYSYGGSVTMVYGATYEDFLAA